jgi:hypothetical protein
MRFLVVVLALLGVTLVTEKAAGAATSEDT